MTGRLKDTREEKGSEAKRAIGGSEAKRAIGCRVVPCSASRSKNPLRVTAYQDCLPGGYHSFWLLLFLVTAPPAYVGTGVF